MEWQPIETAPRDGTRILMGDAQNVETGEWIDEAKSIFGPGWVWPAGFEDDRYVSAHTFEPNRAQPTHWMPLPPPPGFSTAPLVSESKDKNGIAQPPEIGQPK